MKKRLKRNLRHYSNPFPSRSGRTHTIEQVRLESGLVTTSGRLLKSEPRSDEFFGYIEDASGSLVFVFRHSGSAALQQQVNTLETGDFIELTGSLQDDVFSASSVHLLAVSFKGPYPGARDLRSLLKKRSRTIKAVRAFFEMNDFLEIEPPMLVPFPNLELHQEPFETYYRPETGRSKRLFLPSSPEYYLKNALAAGLERIYSIAHSFRNGEYTALHHPEFLIIEWYRAYSSYLDIMEDLEDLVIALNRELNGSSCFSFGGRTIDLTKPWQRLTMAEAFEKYTGIKPDDWENTELLREAFGRTMERGSSELNEWEDLFLALFLDKVEPELGKGKPLLLYDYPARLAALSKFKEGDNTVAERVEMYIEGIELANGYTELNDPREQYYRFQLDQERKVELGSKKLPIDRHFLAAMEFGIPPAGGIALGLDRLFMVLTDQSDIENVIPFSLKEHLLDPKPKEPVLDQ